MKQETFTDMEYSSRKKKTKREEFLEIMEDIIPWEEWVGIIAPYYPQGKRDRPPMGFEKMLRMYLLQIWFHLSDPATEGAIYDSYAMRKFTGINFLTEGVPDETTLRKFRHLLEERGLSEQFYVRFPFGRGCGLDPNWTQFESIFTQKSSIYYNHEGPGDKFPGA